MWWFFQYTSSKLLGSRSTLYTGVYFQNSYGKNAFCRSVSSSVGTCCKRPLYRFARSIFRSFERDGYNVNVVYYSLSRRSNARRRAKTITNERNKTADKGCRTVETALSQVKQGGRSRKGWRRRVSRMLSCWSSLLFFAVLRVAFIVASWLPGNALHAMIFCVYK